MFFSKKIIYSKKLKQNYTYIKNQCGKKICAVVKADGYGHGANNIVKILGEYADFFAVQNLDEALKIRQQFPKIKILVLGYCFDEKLATENNISIMVDSLEKIKQLSKIKTNKKIKIHIKINSGMNRLGISNIKEFRKILKIIKNNKNLYFEGIFTHFFSPKNNKITKKQIKIFEKYLSIIPKCFSPIKHVGGSNLIFYDLPQNIDMVRVGLFLYGYGCEQVEPIMKIVSKVMRVEKIKRGSYVGYEEKYRASKPRQIALIPLGYADGVPRELAYKHNFYLYGKQCKIVGLVCMDMFMLDVTNSGAKVGDEIIVFSDASTWAKYFSKSEYEILTSLNSARCDFVVK